MKRAIFGILFLVVVFSAYKFSQGEPLTTDEKAYLRGLRIGGDIERVRVHRNTWLAQHISPGIRWGTVIPAIPYHIFTIDRDEYSGNYLPFLAHEYTHIVTVEKGLPARRGPYDYGGLNAVLSHHFAWFNSEQQASIVEDYARLRDAGLDTAVYRGCIDELAEMPERPETDLSTGKTLVYLGARIYLSSHRGVADDSVPALAGR